MSLTDDVQGVQLVLAVRKGSDDLVTVIMHSVLILILHINRANLRHNKTETESIILLEDYHDQSHTTCPILALVADLITPEPTNLDEVLFADCDRKWVILMQN